MTEINYLLIDQSINFLIKFFYLGFVEKLKMPAQLQKRHAFPIILAPIMIALGFVLFKLFTASKVVNPETGRTSRVSLNPEQEQRLGLEAYEQVRKDEASRIVSTGPNVDLVKRVTDKLARAAAEKAIVKYNWEVCSKISFLFSTNKIFLRLGKCYSISREKCFLFTWRKNSCLYGYYSNSKE